MSKGILVTGVGETTAVPDVMTVDIGVSVRADTVAEATATARTRSNTLIETLTTSGVEREDVATAGYSVHPEFDHHQGRQRLLGYRVSNDLRVKLRDIETAGESIDRAVAAVGDEVTVGQVSFSVSDDSAAREEARELAWADALAKGRHLAELAGRTLGRAVSIIESSGRGPGPRPMLRMAAMADSTPIEAGASAVSVSLEVRFDLV